MLSGARLVCWFFQIQGSHNCLTERADSFAPKPQAEEMRAQAHEAELVRIAEQEAREAAERQRKMEEAAAKQRAKEEEIERRKQEVRQGFSSPLHGPLARGVLVERRTSEI